MRKSTLLAFGFLVCFGTAAVAQPGGFGQGQFGKGGGFGKKKAESEPAPIWTPPKVMRWEYRVESAVSLGGRSDVVTGLNKIGAEGWELTAIEPSDKGRSTMYYFRRLSTGKPKADAEPKPGPETSPKEKAETKLEVRMYHLKNANAQDAATLLTDVLRTGRADPLRVAADPRTNQVIVYGSPLAHVEIEALLQRLDVPDASPQAPGGNKKSSKLPGFGK